MSTRFGARSLATLAVAGFAFAGTPREAHALLQLSVQVGGSLFYASDNNAGTAPVGYTVINDTSGTSGILQLADQGIGGLQVNGSLHTSTMGPPLNILNSSSLSVLNNTGASVTAFVVVADTNFPGPSDVSFASGSGTWQTADGSSIMLQWFNDPDNVQYADGVGDVPGLADRVFMFQDTAAGPADSFSASSGPIAVNDPGLYSMALTFGFTLTPGGGLISRGQTEIKPVSVIPEPGTMAMAALATPILGLGYLRHRRRKVG